MEILRYSGLRRKAKARHDSDAIPSLEGRERESIDGRTVALSLYTLQPIALILILLFISVTGCAKTARYSPEELKGFPPEIQEHIKSGEVVIGMTTQQVRYAWGAPSAINVLSPTEDGKMREEWIYSKMGLYLDKRLLFIDGKLVDIFPAPKPSGK